MKPSFLIMVLFYESIVDCIAQNIGFLFVNKMNISGYMRMENDISAVITELLLFCFLIGLIFLKRVNLLKICFTKLTIPEYIILFFTCSIYSTLQFEIYVDSDCNNLIRKLSIVTFALLMMVIMHIIMVRDQNISMNNMIGNLKEPMKQITESYIEMNEKNTELRRFRHDTKNLLIALRSLVSEGKNDQALEYIDKMQTGLDTAKIKMFETGNHIADALLESKAKTAHRYGIKISIEGNIPNGNIEDVDLVILLSNLLDNAIEASIQTDGDKFIEIRSILKKNIWILNVKNPCDKEVIIKDNRIESTKDDNEAHGFGLANIERITSKYNGRLQLSFEDHIFTATTIVVSEE